jgi:ribosomal protein S18 acetylase RimI-like enzyme
MMISENIRRVQACDLKKIVELEQKCFTEQNSYSKKQLHYLITKANSCCLAEVQNDVIRGFVIILYRNGTRVAGIETLSVDPIFRGLGIGKQLLIAAEGEMDPRFIRRIRLEVSSGNAPAIHLYEKLGFKKIALLKDYYLYQYHGTNDAYRMAKNLAI